MAMQSSGLTALSARAEELEAYYGALPASLLLRIAACELFPGRLAVVTSFGSESAVLLHLVAHLDPDLPVIFLDTGQHFPETLAYRDHLVSWLGLRNVTNLSPRAYQLAAADPDGSLWQRDPDYCCHLRKVIPLEDALATYEAWVAGRKRYHGDSRSTLPVFQAVGDKIQINPLARWSAAAIEAAFLRHDLPRHPLSQEGYRSIGCASCTRRTPAGAGARGGRWLGRKKTECGIHQARRPML